MEYTTVKTLKETLGIDSSDTSKDTLLERLIKTISKQFDNYLGFSLWENIYKQYIRSNWDFIIVDYIPVNSILTIRKENPAWEEIKYTRIDEQIIYLEKSYIWTIYIEYKAWFTTLDDIPDVENACIELCVLTYKDTPVSWSESNVKSKKIDTLSKTFFSKKEMLDSWGYQMNFKEVLDNYRLDIYNPIKI